MVRQDRYTISKALPLTDDVVSVTNGEREFSRIAEIKHWGNEAGRAGNVVTGIFRKCTGGITKNHRRSLRTLCN
jgi:hypothetical protein